MANIGNAASVDTACAGSEERVARASPSQEKKDSEDVAKAMVVPLNEFMADQAEAAQDGGEVAATAATAPSAPVVTETLEVAASADVGHAASVDTSRRAEGTERSSGTWTSTDNGHETVAKAMVVPADKFEAGQAESS